jgi:hypothetical protein
MTTTYYLTVRELNKISQNPFLKNKLKNSRVVIIEQRYKNIKNKKNSYWTQFKK